MTYILRTTNGEFEQTRTFATATDAAAALDAADVSPVRVVHIQGMSATISEAELRRDAQHEMTREPLQLPDVSVK